MKKIKIERLDDERVAAFHSLTEAQLRNRLDPENALIIVESPKVIKVALEAGYEPVAMLTEERHIEGDASEVIAMCPEDMPVYTGGRKLLASITGYTLTRGVLTAMKRPADRAAEAVTEGARRVVVIDSVTDTTNIGAMFRSAAALGIDAVLLTRRSCDPLNRRSVRVSMGTVFMIPWAWIDDAVDDPRRLGLTTAAMALTYRSVGMDDERLRDIERLAIIMGTEGEGLEKDVIERADWTVKIPMARGVDSLNVAAAAAVACWELRVRGKR